MDVVELKVPEATDAIVASPPSEDTVFTVLAKQARRRSISELRTTAIGCAFNSFLLLIYHPSLSWLAAAFAAASAYGVWGLSDRLVLEEMEKESPHRESLTLLRVLKAGASIGGSGAALWAAFRFMAAALGGWQH